MAPKKTITMRDLTAKHKSAEVLDVYNRALKRAYEYQQETLKKASKIK